MGMVVNTNIGSLVAQAAANATNKSMDTSMERLSTGKRINSAADDAAGMAISSRLEAQSRGLNQAIRNAADGQAMIDTTEGAHAEITNILQRMRELAVQSANDTNVSADRSNLQAEVTQLIAEIDRIAGQTTWNGVAVLDGTFTAKQLQIGAQQGQTTSFSVDSAKAAAIGSYKIAGTAFAVDSNATTTIAADTDGSISGYLGSATIAVTAGDSAKDYAAAVNAKTGSTGVTATAVTKAKIHSLGAAGTVTFNLVGDASAAISATMSTTGDLGALKTAINQKSGVTGITANLGSTAAELILTHATGEDIVIDTFTHTVSGATGTFDFQALDADGATADSTDLVIDDGTNGAATGSVVGQVDLHSIKAFTTADLENSGEDGFFGTSAGSTAGISNIASVNIATTTGAASAITAIDGAISKINNARAELGGLSNRLDSTIANLTNIKTNADVSRSNIEDADFAAETSNLAKMQILSQAATSMLAQANQSKQSILALLQG